MSPAARKTSDRKSVRLFVRSLIALLVAVALGPVATAEAQIEAPPGGPVLVADLGDGFTDFYGEILRAEGLNEFDVRPLTAQSLAGRQVVILAAGNPSAAQVALLDDWVRKGGNLIAMRPRGALAGLLGLGSDGGDLANGYLQVNADQGVTADTMQFHGIADRWTLAGATPIAKLFTDADSATPYPAVTVRDVGAGHAAAFTYDLARSIVYTRQGNPDWAGMERDGVDPVRADDLFFGGGEADWVDLRKVQIPQADEQQRLLANLITRMNLARAPLPRFWYLPRGLPAAVVMTGDDHGTNGTTGQFNVFENDSPNGCSVPDWQCVRATSYVYADTSIPGASGFEATGFELALHLDTGCANKTDAQLENLWANQLETFGSPVRTSRTHCIAWSGWVNDAIIERAHGVRLDTNYYYWPGSWMLDYPGMFTGSGFPMRFADNDGSLVDVYQAPTQLTDEWGSSQVQALGVAAHIRALLDRAVGPEGYYGVFTANMHTDSANVPHPGAAAIVDAAQARGIPVISAEQLLDWLDGRNGSSFQDLSYGGGQLRFTVASGPGARGLEAMLPANGAGGALLGLTRNGAPVGWSTRTVKGIDYAVFPAAAGAYVATYPETGTPGSPPVGGGTGLPPAGGTTPPSSSGTKGVHIDGGPTTGAVVRAKIMRHTARVNARGVVRLKVRCPRREARCSVDVRLRHLGRPIAKTAATLIGGRTTVIKPRLTRRARLLLARTGSLQVKAILRLTRGEAAPTISTTRVRLLASGWR